MIFNNESAFIYIKQKETYGINEERSTTTINDLGYGESRTPLFFEYVQANIAIAVNVGMEYLGPECNLQNNLLY